MKKLFLILLFLLPLYIHTQIHQWHKGIGGTIDDEIFDMTHDASGNIYVTGIFEGTADLDPGVDTANFTVIGAGDMFFAKYDPNGNLIWVKTVGSIGDEEGQGIKLDGTGNIYLTGLFSDVADFDPSAATANLSSNGGFDIYIAKYDNNGNYIWAKNFGDSGNGDDYPSKMAIDGNANIYVTGQFTGSCDFDAGAGTDIITSSGGMDIFFTKYDSNGNYQWAKTIDNTTNADDYGYNITVDGAANVYVTGQYDGTCDFDAGAGTDNLITAGGWDLFITKYDSSGNYIWAKSIGGSGDDGGYSIVVNAGGDIYVAGYFTGTADFDAGAGMANLISAGSEDICYFKYDNSGNYIWAKGIGGSNTDQANSITLDGSGNILLSGQFSATADLDPDAGIANFTSAGAWDIFFAKYLTDGSHVWSYGIGGIGTDQSHVIDVVGGGFFVIAGEVPDVVDFDPGAGTANYTSIGLDDAFFAKYYDGTAGLEENLFNLQTTVYPNPTPGNFTIEISNPGTSALPDKLLLFNNYGELVTKWKMEKNELDISVLSNGIYYLQIGNKIHKIILSK